MRGDAIARAHRTGAHRGFRRRQARLHLWLSKAGRRRLRVPEDSIPVREFEEVLATMAHLGLLREVLGA